MKKLGTGSIALIIVLICFAGTISMIELKNQNDALQVENETLKSENGILESENEVLKSGENPDESIELVPCYLCGGVVKIQPVNERFYIACTSCGLRTDFFKYKSELIRYWNRE